MEPIKNSNRSIVTLLTLVVLVLDLSLPVDAAVSTVYGIAVLATLYSTRISDTYWAAIAGVWLTILVLLVSPIISTAAIINELIAIIIIATTGIFVYSHKKAKIKISELNILSTTDTLTLAKNQLAFNEIMPIEILRAKRYNRSLSLATFSVDEFTSINKKMGKRTADKYLQQLISKIKSMVRHCDLIYRLEGDEFVVVFVETEMVHVVAVVQEICQKIAKTPLTNKKIMTTMSVGVDTCESTDDIDSLLLRTKNALQNSQHLGGNQVSTIQQLQLNSVRAG